MNPELDASQVAAPPATARRFFAGTCQCAPDPVNRAQCGKPSTLVVYGAPCNVCDIRGLITCSGHEVCDFHGADLRAKAYPEFPRMSDSPTFTIGRIHSIPGAES